MDSPVPQFLPPTTGDTTGATSGAPRSDFAQRTIPVPQVTYGGTPGATPGAPVATSQIVPPDQQALQQKQ